MQQNEIQPSIGSGGKTGARLQANGAPARQLHFQDGTEGQPRPSPSPQPGASSSPPPLQQDDREIGKAVSFNIDNVDYISEESIFSEAEEEGSADKAPKEFSVEDGQGLINNSVSQALNVKATQNTDIHRCLQDLGIFVQKEEDVAEEAGAEGHAIQSLASSGGNEEPRGRQTREAINRRVSLQGSGCYMADRQEHHLLSSMFQPNRRYIVKDQHASLGRVIRNIFPQEDVELKMRTDNSATSSAYTLKVLWFSEHLTDIRLRARWLTSRTPFAVLFITLTIYSLFSLDAATVWGTKEVDDIMLHINSAVFVLFVVELFFLCMGTKRYWFTVPFLLDLVSLASIFSDTSFMRNADSTLDEEQSRLTRLARTSKMTRLARIARVARITKLIPKLLLWFRKQNSSLARQVLMRRLWRIFLFLDTDCDKFVCGFDLKVFYIAVLQECPHVFETFQECRLDLLASDVDMLVQAWHMQDDIAKHIDFDHFYSIIMSTKLGHNMIRWHHEEVEHETGVWNVTQKLSDSTALKVCIGILFLVTMISVLEIEEADHSVNQSLAQLEDMAREEHNKGDGMNLTYMCDQINIYVRSLQMPPGRYVTLLLHLDGYTHYEREAGCLLPPNNTTDPIFRAGQLRDASLLRKMELPLSCWPGSCFSGSLSVVTLIDTSHEVGIHALYAMITIVVIIVLLLIFVYVLNMKINMFSGNLLQPLRSLVDDMMAMSCLELVHIDEDMPVEKSKPIQVAEELEHLQNAFKSMRSAIRSWSKYVPPCVVERLYISGCEATIGVVSVHVTILFADIEGFAETCRSLGPNEILDLLSSVFGAISEVVHKNQGTLLEFIGDEMLVVFNTPTVVKHHSTAGIRTALGIHQVVAGKCHVKTEQGKEVMAVCRVGLHTGNILAGNIGSYKRMKYGLLGDGINLSARLKGLSSRYGTRTLCSDQVVADENGRVQKIATLRPVDIVAVKGKSKPTTVYDVMQVPKSNQKMAEAAAKHEQAFNLYQARKFELAHALFEEVATTIEKANSKPDEPSRMLMSRCKAYIAVPPPEDWDGVDKLTSKSFAGQPPAESPGAPGNALGLPSIEVAA